MREESTATGRSWSGHDSRLAAAKVDLPWTGFFSLVYLISSYIYARFSSGPQRVRFHQITEVYNQSSSYSLRFSAMSWIVNALGPHPGLAISFGTYRTPTVQLSVYSSS